jgi:hypothetical protein
VAKRIKLFNRKHPPKSVKILGYDIAVRVVPYLESDGIDLLGAYNSESKTIFLLKGCDWKSVLFHEMLHAGFALTGATEGIGYNTEERLVLALEHAIAPLL